MSLAFVENGSITKYPIGAVEIRRKFPNSSFPRKIEEADLASFGVATVHNVEQPSIDSRSERIEEGAPVFDGSQWNQVWNVVALTAEEQQKITDRIADNVRSNRNNLLRESDWTQIPGAPVDAAAWATYRTELRELPEQAGFPDDVTWPTAP